MRTTAPFTRRLALCLALAFLRASTVGAVSLEPGSLAVLEPPLPIPEMRAAWDGIRNGIYLDPLLLVKGREEVSEGLKGWGDAAEAVLSAHRTADRITLDRVQALIEEAWDSYYRFEWAAADEALTMAQDLLRTPGDSGSRARLMFETLILKGIVARASGTGDHAGFFKSAAALDPVRSLPAEKYSPQMVSLYNRIRDGLLEGERVSLSITGEPADAVVRIGGVELDHEAWGAAYRVLPGLHFVEASAPGYEPWSLTLESKRFEPAVVDFELDPIGPEGDPDSYFLERLRAGDRSYLALLMEKLGVDYLLVPDPGGSELRGWLIDGDGRSVDHSVWWRKGEDADTGAARVAGIIRPLRQVLDQGPASAGSPLSLPAFEEGVPDSGTDVGKGTSWRGYAIAVGIVLLVGAAVGAERGQTRIEATW